MTSSEPRGPLAPKLPPTDPPPRLEQRVLATLAQRGLLAPASRPGRRGRWWRIGGALAAGIVLFVAGALTQRAWLAGRITAVGATPRYALLLYGGQAASAAAERERVDEYRQWARGVAARGRYIAGEKLGDESRELTATGVIERPPAGAEALAGFFIVSAPSLAEAESIARSCPHLRHGGRVVLRVIEPT